MTRVPLAATWGAYCFVSSVEIEKNATSSPRQASTVSSSTAISSPRNRIRRPTERADAYSRSESIDSLDASRMSRYWRPTMPVAPITPIFNPDIRLASDECGDGHQTLEPDVRGL